MPLILRIHTYRKQTPENPLEKSFDPLGGTIGRGTSCDLVLHDDSKFISRTHCKVDYRDGEYYLTDLGSNPSFINQRPVGNGKQVRLGHGDVVDIGEYQLHAVLAGSSANAAPAPLSPLANAPAATASLYSNNSPDFQSPLDAPSNMFDPLANAKILDVGAGLGGHVPSNHDPLGLGGAPATDPLSDPLFGRPGAGRADPGAFIGSEQDHLAGHHMPMPVFQQAIPDDFLSPMPAPAPSPAGFAAGAIPAIRPTQNFIPDDFDLLAPAPAPAPMPAPMPAPTYPPANNLPASFDPFSTPAPSPAPAPLGFDPLAPAPLPNHLTDVGAGTANILGNDFDPLGGTSAANVPGDSFADPLSAPIGTPNAAPFADPLAPPAHPVAPVAPVAPISAPTPGLAADFDPLGGPVAAGGLGADFDPLGGVLSTPTTPAPGGAPIAPVVHLAPAGPTHFPPIPAPAPNQPIAPAPVASPAPVFAPIPAPTPLPMQAPAFAPIPAPAQAHQANQAAHAAQDAEVLAALLRGLGLSDLKTKYDGPQLAELVGAMLREAVDGTMGVLLARSMTKREIRIEATMIAPKGNNPMKFFPDSEAALTQMLSNAWAGYMPGVKAMSNAFDDLRAHELATIAGMRAALGGVLARFDPVAIESRLAEPTVMDKMLASKRKAKMWDRMVELYGQMSNEAEDDFQRLFGEKFADAYEEQTERMRQGKKE